LADPNYHDDVSKEVERQNQEKYNMQKLKQMKKSGRELI
jgi:hypothetical protein